MHNILFWCNFIYAILFHSILIRDTVTKVLKCHATLKDIDNVTQRCNSNHIFLLASRAKYWNILLMVVGL